MSGIELFPAKEIIGTFRGFREGGLEFHADLVLPYRNDFQSIPMHGQFLLVQLESINEAVLGRITSFSSDGKLASSTGDEFNIRAMREDRPVPEDLREQYLRYRVNIRVLGVVRNNGKGITFVPSHRRLPHVGSKVAFASDKVIQEIAGHNNQGAAIGFFALGEYIYAGANSTIKRSEWMQLKNPEVIIKFPIANLVARRTFIFARAGFGKSNLNKLLFSKLYEQTPTVTKRGGKEVPVGTIIFDPDGEYFWPDDKGRPGLCDVPALQNQLVVFTPRTAPSLFYDSFVAGGIKLDLRQIRPSDVISIALPAEKQQQQNVSKLRGLSMLNWKRMIDLIDNQGNQADLEQIRNIMALDERQDAEALAARSNMTTIVKSFHDKSSQLWDKLIFALKEGKLCVIDVSQMRGNQSLIFSGLILRRIFDRNQQEFTSAEAETIPTIAVVEEAQSVLNEKSAGAEPYIEWVKEGRKYDLGALLITQQPGSIPVDILSQGDNWFIFHLLSSADLTSLKRANAHFSEDLLSSLLNEPIPGHGVFWSSVGGQQYPLSLRALSFEEMYTVQDPQYNLRQLETYAMQLKQHFENMNAKLVAQFETVATDSDEWNTEEQGESPLDYVELYKRQALFKFKEDYQNNSDIRINGFPWGKLKGILAAYLPDELDDKDTIAFHLVVEALEFTFGPKDIAWVDDKRPAKNGKMTAWAKVLIEEDAF